MRIFLVRRDIARVDHEMPETATVVAATATDARVVLGDKTDACPRSEWLRADTTVTDIGNAADGAPAHVLLMTYAPPYVRP